MQMIYTHTLTQVPWSRTRVFVCLQTGRIAGVPHAQWDHNIVVR